MKKPASQHVPHLPSFVERVLFVDRESIVADVIAVTSLVDGPLALVAIAAERAQRATRTVVIALMCRVVISDRRREMRPPARTRRTAGRC